MVEDIFEIDPNAYASAYIQTLVVDESKFENPEHRESFFSDQYIKAFDNMHAYVQGKNYDEL